MEDRSSTHTFPNLHYHHHRPLLHLSLPSVQSLDVGHPSTQHVSDSYGQREEPSPSLLSSGPSPGGRRGNNRGGKGVLNTGGNGLDGDASVGQHLDEERGLGYHFTDAWYDCGKREDTWENGKSNEGTGAGGLYGKFDSYCHPNDVFYTRDCVRGDGFSRGVRSNYNSNMHNGCDAKTGADCIRESNRISCSRASFSDSSGDYCKSDSRVSDHFLRGEDEYKSGENQLQPAEVEQVPWLGFYLENQDGSDGHTLASGNHPQISPVGINHGAFTQKLDSFSEAFLSSKKRYKFFPGGPPTEQMWEFGKEENFGWDKSRHSCAFNTDIYPPPSSSSPTKLSIVSFPSPPTSSQLMPSVLSPPPTPLPPPSHSPSKVESPSAVGATANSPSQWGESAGKLQFFASHLPPLPANQSSGMISKFPSLSRCLPQSSDDPNALCNMRSSQGGDYCNVADSHILFQSPESSFPTSSSLPSSLQPSRSHCPSDVASLNASCHLASRRSGKRQTVKNTASQMAPQKTWDVSASLSKQKKQACQIYTGTPFPSILHSSKGSKRSRYTPRPLLNPQRCGKGLYSSLLAPNPREDKATCGKEDDERAVLAWVNVGSEFQAELPPCSIRGQRSEEWPQDEGSPRDYLLWKPWRKLEENINHVEKLLMMCSSSCLPGGGSNTELALHCLHSCQGDTVATLEMLLLTQPSPTGNYRYSGSDFWKDSEKSLFIAALGTCGKDFSLIQKVVKTKTVCQCVEFYYMGKKLLDKQRKQKEEENRDGEVELQKNATPISEPISGQLGLEEAVPIPSLASFFPCKLCGKMFYKIKSRNAHMKIHRQPQDDWADRRLQQHLLNERLALSCPTNIMPALGSNLLQPQAPSVTFPSTDLPGTMSNSSNSADIVLSSFIPGNSGRLDPSIGDAYSNICTPNYLVNTSADVGKSKQKETNALSSHHAWASFGQTPEASPFYSIQEMKDTEIGGM